MYPQGWSCAPLSPYQCSADSGATHLFIWINEHLPGQRLTHLTWKQPDSPVIHVRTCAQNRDSPPPPTSRQVWELVGSHPHSLPHKGQRTEKGRRQRTTTRENKGQIEGKWTDWQDIISQERQKKGKNVLWYLLLLLFPFLCSIYSVLWWEGLYHEFPTIMSRPETPFKLAVYEQASNLF